MDGFFFKVGIIIQVLTGPWSVDPLPDCSNARAMTQGTGSTRALGSVARSRRPRVSGWWTYEVSRNASHVRPCPGNRTVVIETSPALGGEGEAAEEREA